MNCEDDQRWGFRRMINAVHWQFWFVLCHACMEQTTHKELETMSEILAEDQAQSHLWFVVNVLIALGLMRKRDTPNPHAVQSWQTVLPNDKWQRCSTSVPDTLCSPGHLMQQTDLLSALCLIGLEALNLWSPHLSTSRSSSEQCVSRRVKHYLRDGKPAVEQENGKDWRMFCLRTKHIQDSIQGWASATAAAACIRIRPPPPWLRGPSALFVLLLKPLPVWKCV